MIFGVTPEQVRAFVDLSQVVSGQNYFRLTTDNIRTPLGTEITKISPSSIRLTIEAVKTRSVPVKARLAGKLSDSLQLKSVSVEPAYLIIRGPETPPGQDPGNPYRSHRPGSDPGEQESLHRPGY